MVVCVNLKYLLLMGINEYITKNHKRLLDIAKNVTKGHQLTYDLFQHCIEIILIDNNKDKIQFMVDNDQLHFYFTALCIRNYNSNTSRFHYIYRKPNEANSEKDVYQINVEDENWDQDKELKIIFIEQQLQKMKWYERKMVELYFNEGLSYQKISNITGIPKTSCWNTIQLVINEIKENYGS